jgi:hypothetical protein
MSKPGTVFPHGRATESAVEARATVEGQTQVQPGWRGATSPAIHQTRADVNGQVL